MRRTMSRALLHRPWLLAPYAFGRRGGGARRRAGGLPVMKTMVVRRPAVLASIPCLAARPSARSSIGRERRRGIVALTGAWVLRRAPKGEATKLGISARVRVHGFIRKIGIFHSDDS
jgi:hypothetical protein